MKIVLDLPQRTYRAVKLSAALKGCTVNELITEAISVGISHKVSGSGKEYGWRAVFGKASRKDTQAVDAILKREVGGIDKEGW